MQETGGQRAVKRKRRRLDGRSDGGQVRRPSRAFPPAFPNTYDSPQARNQPLQTQKRKLEQSLAVRGYGDADPVTSKATAKDSA